MNESARKEVSLTNGDPGVTFKVFFNSNGGSTVRPQYVAENKTAVQPANPVRDGYVFAGWYTDTGLTKAYYFGTAVTGDFTLYARWSTVGSTFRVQFDTGGGSAVPDQKEKIRFLKQYEIFKVPFLILSSTDTLNR